MSDTGTWHYGLVARWWAEFNEPEAREVDYLRRRIEQFGQPALDTGVGAGRLLLPLLKAGLDVDGVDVSADMLEYAREAADRSGFSPTLSAQAFHELALRRRYRTIYSVGSFGIGVSRADDREGLRRIYEHLEPGGVLLLNQELPWAAMGERQWQLWRSADPADLPRPWPGHGDRKRLADGDEIELASRTAGFDRLEQRLTLEMRARLWHAGKVVHEEESRLTENLYFAHELAGLLRETGFESVEVEGGYTGTPVTVNDDEVMFVATRGAS